jgi:hypothetical protein
MRWKESRSPEEFASYHRAVGKIIAPIMFDVLEPLYSDHPTLKPSGGTSEWFVTLRCPPNELDIAGYPSISQAPDAYRPECLHGRLASDQLPHYHWKRTECGGGCKWHRPWQGF